MAPRREPTCRAIGKTYPRTVTPGARSRLAWGERLVEQFALTAELNRTESHEVATWLRQVVLTPAVRQSQTELTAAIEAAIRRFQAPCDAAA